MENKILDVLEYIKDDGLRQFAKDLLFNGFKIHTMSYSVSQIRNGGLKHFSYSKESDNVYGYVQRERFEGYSLSSEYVPSRENGCGQGGDRGWDILTIENAIKNGTTTENVYYKGNKELPKPYKSFKHFQDTKTHSGSYEMYIQSEVKPARVEEVFPIEGRDDFSKYVVVDNGEIRKDMDGKEMYFDDKASACRVCVAVNNVYKLNEEFYYEN